MSKASKKSTSSGSWIVKGRSDSTKRANVVSKGGKALGVAGWASDGVVVLKQVGRPSVSAKRIAAAIAAESPKKRGKSEYPKS